MVCIYVYINVKHIFTNKPFFLLVLCPKFSLMAQWWGKEWEALRLCFILVFTIIIDLSDLNEIRILQRIFKYLHKNCCAMQWNEKEKIEQLRAIFGIFAQINDWVLIVFRSRFQINIRCLIESYWMYCALILNLYILLIIIVKLNFNIYSWGLRCVHFNRIYVSYLELFIAKTAR